MQVTHRISFGQAYLSKPTQTEAEGESAALFPRDARIRGLTYSAPLYVDVKKEVIRRNEDMLEEVATEIEEKVFVGKVRVMLMGQVSL